MRKFYCEGNSVDLDVMTEDDVDLDGTFDAICIDTGERLKINGWMFICIERDIPVEIYRDIQILRDQDDGFHASDGICNHFGYCDTIEAIRAEIDDYHADSLVPGARYDTPSLDTSFHDHEMDV